MSDEASSDVAINSRRTVLLICSASLSALCYAVLLKLSWQFSAETAAEERPTIAMLGLFGGLFVVYWTALWLAVRLPETRILVTGIFGSALLFRGILLPSIPMHEIDLYRYIWDGAVLAEGVSPYRYPPKQVVEAVNAGGVDHDPVLQQLVELQASSGSLNESLNTIHYGQYPSPYPVVSQAVFALAAHVTPDASSSHTRMVIMKALLVLFDLATLWIVILLLRETGRHPGWSLAYGWCPLVMKEIANGGHLDSIAIFFTTLAVLLLVKSVKSPHRSTKLAVCAGGALALAIGAKLYPVILTPLFAAVWFRRISWRAAGLGVAIAGLFTALLLYPLLGAGKADVAHTETAASDTQPVAEAQLIEPPPATTAEVESDDGVKAFLNMWEMNDLLFMLVLENLRNQEKQEPGTRPWFVFTSGEWSRGVVTRYALAKQSLLGEGDLGTLQEPLTPYQLKRTSFSLARLITGGVFMLFACVLAWCAAGRDHADSWCRAAMLTLAWFWFTCPTQNPWYWCWVVPLLPFAKYRAWHAVAAVTMLYYLRFWLMTHYPAATVLGTTYNGTYFFYFVIAWVEFFPVLAALFFEAARVRWGSASTKKS